MNSVNIAVIGECMVELQKKSGEVTQSFGGDTLNTALYLSRLTQSHGIKTSYVTALGNDLFSDAMLKNWKSEGLDTDLIQRIEGKQPGLYYIETDDTGERSFLYWRNDAAAKYLFDQPTSDQLIEKLLTFDAVYLSGITLAILTNNGREVLFRFLKSFKEKGGKVFFDNNYRPKLWHSQHEAIGCYQTMLQFTDTALLTFDDEKELYGDSYLEQCIERTTQSGVQEIIIKRGSKECLVIAKQSAQYVPATFVENVLDTTAAGDSFSAGFLAKRLCGGSATEAASAGHTVAGRVIQHQGAIIPVQAMPELSL